MERGVIVGALMICGSFLLAAMLNYSAMEEAPAAPVPIKSVAPVAPPVLQPAAAPSPIDCAEMNTRVDANRPTVDAEPPRADLMVNGPDSCRR